MNERHRLTIGLLKAYDLAVLFFVFALTTIVVAKGEQGISVVHFLSLRIRVANFGIIVLASIIWHVVFQACGLYRSRRLSRRRTEIGDVFKAVTMNTACFVVLGSAFAIRMVTVQFLAIFWAASAILLCSTRLLFRFLAARVRSRGKDLRYMLILGSNLRAIQFAQSLLKSPERGYRLLGFVDDDWPGIGVLKEAKFDLVSDYAGLAEFLRRNVVDEVAVYLPFASFYRHSSQVVQICEQHGITMRFSSDLFGMKSIRWRAEELHGDHYIATYKESGELWPRTIKRLLDVTVATGVVVVCLPILIAAAIAIKLTSPGPVLFLQERMGLNKRRFRIFKFRTMVQNAEKLILDLEKHNEMSGPVFKIRNDPRITTIGRLLRRSSIDELPQLFNVLKGDMSLVGPRPLPVRDYEGFNEDWQRRRFSVKPGITCLWQVNGRSEISFDQWMLLDLQYMDEWSIWLDLKILAKTVPAVLRGAGAA